MLSFNINCVWPNISNSDSIVLEFDCYDNNIIYEMCIGNV